MLLHASCAARCDSGKATCGVLIVGPSGAGKSDLLLRLIDRGFRLVADDQVLMDGLQARPPDSLAGLIEIRGLGIVRMAHLQSVRLALVVQLGRAERLPMQSRYEVLDLPMISVDPWAASAPLLVELALDGLQGKLSFVAGAFG
jgi:HPr kinase/phosphorylase